jgi:tetratricopeptide (TPR) repeat protein
MMVATAAYGQDAAKMPGQPDAVEQHFGAAQTYQLAGDYEKAAAEYRATIARALQRLGNLRVSQGKYADGIELLTAAAQVEPLYVDAGIDLAIAHFYGGDFQKSKSIVEKVLQQDGQSFRALNLLGKIHFMENNFQGAAERLQAALKIQPDFDVAYSLALADLELKKQAAAGVLFDEMLASSKPSAQLYALIGVAYRETGYFDLAVTQFAKAISLDPKFPRVHSALALVYLSEQPQKYAQAREQFMAELAIAPNDYLSHYFLGVIDLHEHKLSEAQKWLEEATRLQPQGPDAFFNLGEAYFQDGRFEKAVAALRRSLVLVKDSSLKESQGARAHYVIGQALQKLGKKDEAAAEIGRSQAAAAGQTQSNRAEMGSHGATDAVAVEVKQSGHEDLRTTLMKMPTKAITETGREAEYVKSISRLLGDSYHNLGVIDARSERYGEAAAEFGQAARWNPNIDALDQNWGVAAFRANRYDEAITPLERQLKRKPDDMLVREMLGISYFMIDKFNSAAQVLGPIVDRLPSNPGLLYAAGVALVRSGKAKEGERVFSQMLQQNANVPEVHLMLGEAHAQQSEYADALTEFSRALQLNPKLAEAHYYSGKVHFKQGRMDDAAQEFQAELALNPQNMSAMYELAYVRLTQHQTDEAIVLLRDVVTRKPDHADAHYELGKAMLEKGDVTAAIENLETAARLQPSADYNYYQLSLAYRRVGRLDAAQRALHTYQDLKERRRTSGKTGQQN